MRRLYAPKNDDQRPFILKRVFFLRTTHRLNLTLNYTSLTAVARRESLVIMGNTLTSLTTCRRL